jgi:hypothetical protein
MNRDLLTEMKGHLDWQMEERLFGRVPFAREFHTGEATDLAYYRRHLMETVIRIRLNNEVDAFCLHKIAHDDHKLAGQLATYLAEELGHEDLFLADLKRLGVSREQLDATPPFIATRKLIGFMYHSIDKDGPMPTMTWNWLVEWYSDKFNKTIAQKAAAEFGDQSVKGSMAHLGIDDHEDHVSLMFGTVEATIHSDKDVTRAKEYLTTYVELVVEYFQELYDATIGKEVAVTV